MKQGHLTIIRGLPGSGKSTMARELLESSVVGVHFEADMFFMLDGAYLFDPAKIKEAHEWCQQSVRQALADGVDVVVSNTFVKHWEMKAYLEMCPTATIVVATGNYANLHGVPAEVLERMRGSWEA